MLACNVSLLRRRAAIAAELAEAAAAVDTLGTGNVVFATLVDDPASVNETVDAFLGEIMLEAATAIDTLSATIPAVLAADVAEAATAADAQDGTIGVLAITFDSATTVNTMLSNGNLTATHSNTTANSGARVLHAKSTGKYYFEITCVATFSTGNGVGVLLSTGTFTDLIGVGSNCLATYTGSGNVWGNGAASGKTIGTISAGNIIGIAVDLTAHLGWIRKGSGNWNGDPAANPATGAGGVTFQSGAFDPAVGFGSAGAVNSAWTGNFGASAYANSAPSGFGNWTP
jgi:hypothetical protein